MTSAYLLQSNPMFQSKDSPKSSSPSPVLDCLIPAAHTSHASQGHRPLLTESSRFQQGHAAHRSTSVSSQHRCPPHFHLPLPSTSSSSSPSLHNESRHRVEQRLQQHHHHHHPYLPHYLQHRNIFSGVMGSPWMPSSGDLNRHLPQLQLPLENMELWQSGSLLSSTAGATWGGFEARGHSVPFPYSYPHMNDVRRKNATRESTTTLKAWLFKHIKNPYPTKGEKVMLALLTKMSLTQVSTWFANARRRLKKENKMQWSPRQRTEEEDEDKNSLSDGDDDDVTKAGDVTDNEEEIEVDTKDNIDQAATPSPLPPPLTIQPPSLKGDSFHFQIKPETSSSSSSSSSNETSSSDKPKIWSLASMVDADDKKSSNEIQTRNQQSDASTNERQTHAWLNPTWMAHAAIYRQMLNIQLQHQRQQQQQHHHHHHQHQQQQHQQQQRDAKKRDDQTSDLNSPENEARQSPQRQSKEDIKPEQQTSDILPAK